MARLGYYRGSAAHISLSFVDMLGQRDNVPKRRELFRHRFEEKRPLGFSIAAAIYSKSHRACVVVAKTEPNCPLYPDKLMPSDEIVAIDSWRVTELRECRVRLEKRPITITFAKGNRRDIAFIEQEERRDMSANDFNAAITKTSDHLKHKTAKLRRELDQAKEQLRGNLKKTDSQNQVKNPNKSENLETNVAAPHTTMKKIRHSQNQESENLHHNDSESLDEIKKRAYAAAEEHLCGDDSDDDLDLRKVSVTAIIDELSEAITIARKNERAAKQEAYAASKEKEALMVKLEKKHRDPETQQALSIAKTEVMNNAQLFKQIYRNYFKDNDNDKEKEEEDTDPISFFLIHQAERKAQNRKIVQNIISAARQKSQSHTEQIADLQQQIQRLCTANDTANDALRVLAEIHSSTIDELLSAGNHNNYDVDQHHYDVDQNGTSTDEHALLAAARALDSSTPSSTSRSVSFASPPKSSSIFLVDT